MLLLLQYTLIFASVLLLVALLFWLAYRTFANRWLAELPLGGYVLVLPLLLFFTGLEIFNKHYFYGINVVHIPAVIQITEQIVRITAVLALLLLIPPSSCWECWAARAIPPST